MKPSSSLCCCFNFPFLSLSSFASAFVSFILRFCSRQRCASTLSESVVHHKTCSHSTRISLGIAIMIVKQTKACVFMCVYPAFIPSAACQTPTWTSFVLCNNIELFWSWQDECYNYIKVLVPRNDETLFACGTNAFNPTCRNYKVRYCSDVCCLLASITDKRWYYVCYEMCFDFSCTLLPRLLLEMKNWKQNLYHNGTMLAFCERVKSFEMLHEVAVLNHISVRSRERKSNFCYFIHFVDGVHLFLCQNDTSI